MLKVERVEEGIKIIVHLDWDKDKKYWVDGVYVSVSNSSAHIFFNKQAEAELRQGLEELVKLGRLTNIMKTQGWTDDTEIARGIV